MWTAAFFDSIPDPLLLCDRSLLVAAVNRAAAALLSRPATELINRSAMDLLPPPAPGPKPMPLSGRVGWRTEFGGQGERTLLEISGHLLQDERTGAQGWALMLKKVGPVVEAPVFLGKSQAVQELLEFVARIAASGAVSILLLGESGTGKELIAKRLHALSGRAQGAFVPINCAALPEALLESELFGFEKGAFTGAAERKEGLLEIADGGTVFLDEIGELPLPLQAKLLRVLEDHTFRRVGGGRNISVDVRVIGATNSDLEKAIEERRFRMDLYYRLNAVQIRLPALRERVEDLAALSAHFLEHFNRVHGRDVRGLHPSARRLLELYSWPGNVRELRNMLERAVLVERSSLITPASLGLSRRGGAPDPRPAPAEPENSRFSLRSSEHELIAAALSEAQGNQTRAAELLGIGRFSLRYKMKKLGIL